MKVAGIDCGTNSIRLLIADYDGTSLSDIVRDMTVVRLGQGVDATGKFADDALERTFAQAERYAALCREHEVENIIFVATSATRDAANKDVFMDGIEARLGVRPQVISGEREAQLSFMGAISVLDDLTGPVVAVDLGGGSTEIVKGDSAGVISAFSMDVGCVRMTERHLHSNPPTGEEIAGATADINAALDEALSIVDVADATRIIGLAGSVTTVTAKALDLPAYDSEKIHGSVLSLEQINEACTWLTGATKDERAAEGYMHPGRIDVIGAGALVWNLVAHRLGAVAGLTEVMTSEHDILDGIALWAAGAID